ncbi:MAG: hypothetical protein ACK5NY_08695 [Burkholderiaceae bacterium]
MVTHLLLDANVLFSEWQQALIFTIARTLPIHPVWTDEILDECFRNRIRLGHFDAAQALRERQRLNALFPSACRPAAPRCLPDVQAVQPKDRHVAAAALALRHELDARNCACAEVVILTWNLRDFPQKPLRGLKIHRVSPDDWLAALIDTHSPDRVYGWLSAAQAVLIGLGCDRADGQRKGTPLPQCQQEWPTFLDRQWFKRSAKVLQNLANLANLV